MCLKKRCVQLNSNSKIMRKPERFQPGVLPNQICIPIK